MIHEGTHGIQAQDLLHRKVRMQEGRALQLLAGRMRDTIGRALAVERLRDHAHSLREALDALLAAAHYFFHYELPKIHAWLAVAARRDPTCHDLDEQWL